MQIKKFLVKSNEVRDLILDERDLFWNDLRRRFFYEKLQTLVFQDGDYYFVNVLAFLMIRTNLETNG